MNNEFKQINNGNEVRYVLEDGGSTTSGAVATVEKSLGELQRRAEPPKPRNFVAKNAKMGGAGKMKDKSKTIPRHEKHKKPVEESEANVSDRELDTIDPQDQGEEEGSFVKNQIHTMLRVLTHLEHAIGDDEDLPEWVQMKLSQAQQSVVDIMDYMISDKEREVERQTGHDSLMKENNGVAEASDRMQRYGQQILKRKAEQNAATQAAGPQPKKEEPPASSDYSSMSTRDFLQLLRRSKKKGVAEDPYFNMLERSVSQAQHNLMVGVANNPQFAQQVKVKQRVGQEFANADQGHDISALPIRVPKKK